MGRLGGMEGWIYIGGGRRKNEKEMNRVNFGKIERGLRRGKGRREVG